MSNITPMMQQYLEIKEKYKDTVLLFRLGDFYETFFEDAEKVSEILQIVLTQRSGNPMAGIPYHALDNYLKKLIDSGLKVAICEQMEDPAEAKGIVKREVTRIITPGTVIEDTMLDDFSRYSALIYKDTENYIISVFDFSTGEIHLDTIDFTESDLGDFISNFGFVQILYNDEMKETIKSLKNIYPKIYFEKLEEWYFNANYESHLKECYGVANLDFLEYTEKELTVLDGVFKYLEIAQFAKIKHFKNPKRFKNIGYMFIDSHTSYNLGILPDNNYRGRTLYDILKKTKNPMGHRKLYDVLSKPLIDKEKIEERLDIVENFMNKPYVSEKMKEILHDIKDIDRISSRISLGKSGPKDIIALKNSLMKIPEINIIIKEDGILSRYFGNIDEMKDLIEEIEKTVNEDPSQDPGDGSVVKKGVNEELDEYRFISENIDSLLSDIEKREKSATGINALKVGRNKIYGYYIEISKGQASNAPEHYIRKQTLTNCERFITDELRKLEQKTIIAENKINKIEKEIFNDFINSIKVYVKNIKSISDIISEIDVLRAFAEVSTENNYIRPVFSENKEVKIKSARHPVVERFTENFTPNDFYIDDKFFVILTGPNMSGKSTYLRQLGLISVMAQCGCFVPAEKAYIPIYDRIFTRIGARDDIITGKSTFLFEMLEMSTILNKATSKSFILLDEVGRGTSTMDGISVAWAISEYIFQNLSATTVFATHYTEMTMMADMYDEIDLKRVAVNDYENGVLFLHKIEDGVSDNSYGIDVAKLAGFPDEVIDRSREVLSNLSDKADLENKLKMMKNIRKKRYRTPDGQIKMF